MSALGIVGAIALAGCGNGIGGQGDAVIDARVDRTLSFMRENFSDLDPLLGQARGVLVMPVITEAGLGLGASYGRGALRVQGATVDYYSATSASAGLQIGAQQFSHVLFFMTPDALRDFRSGSGWTGAADIEYVAASRGEMLRADAATAAEPVIAAVFGQSGLRVGATLEGVKYTRIIP